MLEAKRKLRTAADVISRLKWDDSFGDRKEDLVLGFTDRIHGPLEKSLQDYVPASQGGDIPEHRINYFRLGANIIWDRRSRFDKIFTGSGNEDAVVCEETLSDVVNARATAARLADERQIRLQERIKRSQKRQRKVPLTYDSKNNATTDRHIWATSGISTGDICTKPESTLERFSIVTWNVLFDFYDSEPADHRWRLSMKCLEAEMADIILLQEVTPSYARILLSCDWVTENYKASATLDNMSSVEPHGNLLLWNANVFGLASDKSIFTCFDGDRNRAVLGVLQNEKHVFVVANVHLPADHAMVLMSDENDVISPRERRVARQRERSAIVAKCQLLQEFYESKGCQVTCIVAGDFNIVEEIEVSDGNFSRFFEDSWSVASSERGHTFDPDSNVRAISNKGPRRIDRIFIGDTLREVSSKQNRVLRPLSGLLIGTLDNVDDNKCPSDHYGVRINFELNNVASVAAITPGPKAWSCCSNSCSNTLLALCFDHCGTTEVEKLFDQQSSLPVAHLTMLHGFVELNNDESRRLVINSIEEAVLLALEGKQFSLLFDENSPTVFEHRASASLVYIPTQTVDGSWWLGALYSTLRAVFPQCDDQETRFDNGWCPHGKFDCFLASALSIIDKVTVGTFPTVELARSAAQTNDLYGKKLELNAHSLGVFHRCHEDGKFYMISAIPLVQNQRNSSLLDATKQNISSFIKDSGFSSWRYVQCLSNVAISEVHRACKTILQKHYNGFSAKMRPYGSYMLASSIQGISDIDVVVDISPTHETDMLSEFDFDELLFFQRLQTKLKHVYSRSKLRLRLAGTPGDADFYIMTVKLVPEWPSMDMMLYVHDSFGNTSAAIGHGCEPEKSIDDSATILRLLGSSSSEFVPALRVVKAWAFRRQIYGSSIGFLGGGGWGVLLAFHMLLNKAVDRVYGGDAGKLLASFFLSLPQMLKKPSVDIDLLEHLSEPVALNPTDNAAAKIWSPISRKNHARNSTKGTLKSMIAEAQRARLLVLGGNDGTVVSQEMFEEVLSPFERGHLSGSTILTLLVRISDVESEVSRQELEAWLCRQALSMMLSLEREYGNVGDDVRPLARPEKVENNLSITLAAGFTVAPSFVLRRKIAMQEEFQAAFNVIQEAGAYGLLVDIVRLHPE